MKAKKILACFLLLASTTTTAKNTRFENKPLSFFDEIVFQVTLGNDVVVKAGENKASFEKNSWYSICHVAVDQVDVDTDRSLNAGETFTISEVDYDKAYGLRLEIPQYDEVEAVYCTASISYGSGGRMGAIGSYFRTIGDLKDYFIAKGAKVSIKRKAQAKRPLRSLN